MSLKKFFASGIIFALMGSFWGASPSWGVSPYQYQLYKNSENFGVVIFPKKHIYPELDNFILSLKFKNVQSGEAVMRQGNKKENATYMMPVEVQKNYQIKKFVVLQVLNDQQSIMIGIYDQEFGLTLPSRVFQLEDVKKNLPKTLDVFREQLGYERTPIRGSPLHQVLPFKMRDVGVNPAVSSGV